MFNLGCFSVRACVRVRVRGKGCATRLRFLEVFVLDRIQQMDPGLPAEQVEGDFILRRERAVQLQTADGGEKGGWH